MKVMKFGTSLVVRIPNAMARELGIKRGSPVNVYTVDKAFLVVPLPVDQPQPDADSSTVIPHVPGPISKSSCSESAALLRRLD